MLRLLAVCYRRMSEHHVMSNHHALTPQNLRRCGVSHALTYDHHFQQAGFLALMRDES